MVLAKFVILAVCALTVRAGLIGAPVVEVHHPPHYTFAYDVKDTITGDFKGQVESRLGDVVRGQYSVLDPDGTKRVVDYFADPVHGFNAVVRRAPAVVAPVAPVAPVVAPVARVAPVAPALVAPQLLASPLARVGVAPAVVGPVARFGVAPPVVGPVARVGVAPAVVGQPLLASPVARALSHHPVLPRPALAYVG